MQREAFPFWWQFALRKIWFCLTSCWPVLVSASPWCWCDGTGGSPASPAAIGVPQAADLLVVSPRVCVTPRFPPCLVGSDLCLICLHSLSEQSWRRCSPEALTRSTISPVCSCTYLESHAKVQNTACHSVRKTHRRAEIVTPLERQQIFHQAEVSSPLPAPDLFYSPQNQPRHLYFISYSTPGCYKCKPKEAASSASRKKKK